MKSEPTYCPDCNGTGYVLCECGIVRPLAPSTSQLWKPPVTATDPPTGLTDEEILEELEDEIPCDADAPQFLRVARRIEAIVREDAERKLECSHPAACLGGIKPVCLWCLDAELYEGMMKRESSTARKDERERCAEIADSYDERPDIDTPTGIGAAIRRGGEGDDADLSMPGDVDEECY